MGARRPLRHGNRGGNDVGGAHLPVVHLGSPRSGMSALAFTREGEFWGGELYESHGDPANDDVNARSSVTGELGGRLDPFL